MHLGEPLPEAILQNVEFNVGTLLLFYFLPFLMMMWTNGVGASTGMFVPALAVGATGTSFPISLCLLSRKLAIKMHCSAASHNGMIRCT